VPTILPIRAWWDVPAEWRETPVGEFIAYQNLARPHVRPERATLLIGTCMDGRIVLKVPRGFAFILRTAGAIMAPVEANLSYVLATRDVRYVAVVGHTDCYAVGLDRRRDEVVAGLVRAGWDRARAIRHADEEVIPRGIDDPVASALREARRVADDFHGVQAAALLYDSDAGTVSLLRE
jgi:carbonic anhydrase